MTRTCSASCNPAHQYPSQPSRPPLPSFALISFKCFCCGLFLIHSIRFDPCYAVATVQAAQVKERDRMRLKPAILAGDGIGPEVTHEATNILRSVAELGAV